jgi:SagB-type dehydrogenase family enzyme
MSIGRWRILRRVGAGSAGRDALLVTLSATLFLALGIACASEPEESGRSGGRLLEVGNLRAAAQGEVMLPPPAKTGELSVERAIARRRSVRGFGDEPATLEQLSQLLWAAQGVTGEGGFKRAAPSAGAKYPMEIFVVAGQVEGLEPGIYWYLPSRHSIHLLSEGDHRGELADVALHQQWVREAPFSFVITGVYERTRGKYGERAVRYVHIEVGAVAENVYLQAESLGVGTTFVGAFSDDGVKGLLGVEVSPLGIMPVGVPLR